MEKVRRKRVNNSLDQLRSLLPYSVNMKKDMASLLEQTVEYINIMHKVLNEDKPACLNKVYVAYRQKTEEIESFRRNFKKAVSKRQKTDSGCSWSQPAYNAQGQTRGMDVDPFIKHSCVNQIYYDQLASHNHSWSQQKSFDPYGQNQPSCSGQNQIQYATMPQCSDTVDLMQTDWWKALYGGPKTLPNDITDHNSQANSIACASADIPKIKADSDDLEVQSISCGRASIESSSGSASGCPITHSDIVTAAISTGVINNPLNKPGLPSEGYFSEQSACANQVGSFAPWMTPYSLPPLSLQNQYTNSDVQTQSSSSSAVSIEETDSATVKQSLKKIEALACD